MAGTNVARLPKKYATLHFSTPLPVFDVAKVQPCDSVICDFTSILRTVLCPLEGLVIARLEDFRLINGERSVLGLLSIEPSRRGESPNVTVRLTLSPVLGRIRVAWRSCIKQSSASYIVGLPSDLTLGRKKRRDLMGTLAPLAVELIQWFS